MKYILVGFLMMYESAALWAQLVSAQEQIKADSAQQSLVALPCYPTATMIKLKRKNMSEGLKLVLMNASYAGWEEGDLYIDKSTNDYALFLPDKFWLWKRKNNTDKWNKENPRTGKWHFFSNQGRPVSY